MELSDLAHAAIHLCPTAEVVIATNVFIDQTSRPRQWGDCVLVDTASFGAAHIRKWRFYIWGFFPGEFAQFTPMCHETRTLADAYRLADISPLEGELGVVRIEPFDFVKGLTVFI